MCSSFLRRAFSESSRVVSVWIRVLVLGLAQRDFGVEVSAQPVKVGRREVRVLGQTRSTLVVTSAADR